MQIQQLFIVVFIILLDISSIVQCSWLRQINLLSRIEENCWFNWQCGENAICSSDRRCRCKLSYVIDTKNDDGSYYDCVPYECSNDLQCQSIFGYRTECRRQPNITNICVCAWSEYMELDDTGNHCRSKRCQHDGHCSNGTHCSDDTKRCECKFGHHLMDNGFQCEPIKCTTYYDCAPLDLNSFCTKEGICQCAKDHRLSGQNICVHQNGKIGFWFCLLSILAVIFIIGSCIAMVQQSFRRAVVAVIPSNITDELDWIEPRTNGTNMALRQMTPCKHVFDRDEQRQSMSNIMPPPYEVAIKTETFPTTFRVNRMI